MAEGCQCRVVSSLKAGPAPGASFRVGRRLWYFGSFTGERTERPSIPPSMKIVTSTGSVVLAALAMPSWS